MITGVAFLIICAVGLAIAYGVGSVGILANAVTSSDVSQILDGKSSVLTGLGITAMVALIGSSLLAVVWVFRLSTAGMGFILTVFALYTLGQGIGFGFLFLVLKASQAVAVFGIGGGFFLVMGAVGYFVKNMGSMWKYLAIGTVGILICSLVSLILYLTGVYSQTWVLIVNILFGILMLGYTAYDVWLLRRMAEWSSGDNAASNRVAWFFGFKLLTDLITLIWLAVRLFGRYIR